MDIKTYISEKTQGIEAELTYLNGRFNSLEHYMHSIDAKLGVVRFSNIQITGSSLKLGVDQSDY